MKRWIKQNKKIIIMSCLWLLCMVSIMHYLITTIGAKREVVVGDITIASAVIVKELWVISLIVLILSTAAVLYIVKNRDKGKPEKIFLILYILLALGYGIALPAYKVPDETAHFQ